MAMMKKQHLNPQPLLMFSFAAFICPIITAGFQEPLYWETGLDEETYNLQSEPTFYISHLAGLRGYSASSQSCDSVPFMNIHFILILAYISTARTMVTENKLVWWDWLKLVGCEIGEVCSSSGSGGSTWNLPEYFQNPPKGFADVNT